MIDIIKFASYDVLLDFLLIVVLLYLRLHFFMISHVFYFNILTDK